MSKTLVVAEKPSVARDIAKVLGVKSSKDGFIENDHYIITWCIGHLVELVEPAEYDPKYKSWAIHTLPICPQEFRLKPKQNTLKQFHTVTRLMEREDVGEIVCATDSGIEGQVIFGFVAKLSKASKPTKRLWINSMTDEAIEKGFRELKNNGEYENLFLSGEARTQADWSVGLNITRLMSCINNKNLTVGRVQTPTLAMIVDRQADIDNHVCIPYWQIENSINTVKFLTVNQNSDATNKRNMNNFLEKQEAEDIIVKTNNKEGLVKKVKGAKKYEVAPQLYDLTDLQREANMKYGYSAQETLEIAQTLYEKHKIITYPRTDSKYISEDIAKNMRTVMIHIGLGWVAAREIIREIDTSGLLLGKRIVDDSKITDHHAIIPTERAKDYEKLGLTKNEDLIYRLICTKFLAAISDKYEYKETNVEITVLGESLQATYKKTEKMGWKQVYKTLIPSKKETEEITVVFKEGQQVSIGECKLLEKQTESQKPYTEASLLSAMENVARKVDKEHKDFLSAGLGTPATRAGIIEKLINTEYIIRKGKSLIPTEKGKALIRIIPEEYKSPELTSNWEQKLKQIRSGETTQEEFMKSINAHIANTIIEVKKEVSKYQVHHNKEENNDGIVMGICPKCGNLVYKNKKAYSCAGYKNQPPCNFTLWKDNRFFTDKQKELTDQMVIELLEKGKTYVEGLTSKAGKLYNAMILLDLSNEKWINYKMEFNNGKEVGQTQIEGS